MTSYWKHNRAERLFMRLSGRFHLERRAGAGVSILGEAVSSCEDRP